MGSLAFGGEFFLPALLDSRGTSQQCPKRWRLHNHEADAGCAPPPVAAGASDGSRAQARGGVLFFLLPVILILGEF